ncbi:hypothetical protein I0E98_18095 [Pseudomonas lalucatii]|nr:hypothetical protein [Pseudomonas lalucatii]
MIGGLGNDVYEVTDLGDSVIELAGEGTDTVWTSLLTYTLSANVENLVYSGSGNFTGIGNALANSIRGQAMMCSVVVQAMTCSRVSLVMTRSEAARVPIR